MRTLRIVAWIVAITASAGIANAGGGTALTYQGRLLDAGEPANGLFDFEFELWDAANGGTPIGVPQVLNNTPVTDGLFTVQIDFGADAFDNTDRWLEIVVDATTLSPRQPIARAPYSIQTRGIVVDQEQNVGIGTTSPSWPLHVSTTTLQAVLGETDSTSANAVGVYGRVNSASPGGFSAAVRGENRGTAGFGIGVWGSQNGNGWGVYGTTVSGIGVLGEATNPIAVNYGVLGRSAGNSGRGVFGEATATSGLNYGVSGKSNSTSGRGVFGEATAASGSTYGGRFESHSNTGVGMFGWAAATSGLNYGVWGRTSSPNGFAGYFTGGQNYFQGAVGIGTNSPGWLLEVNGSAAKPGGGSWSNSSDRRLKKNIKDLDGVLDRLLTLRGVTFEYNDPEAINELEGERIGMIAQEVEKVFPDWVNINSRGHKTVTFRGFEALTVEALRDLRTEKDREFANHDKRLTAVARDNHELRARNADLESRLSQLEALVAQLATQQGIEQ